MKDVFRINGKLYDVSVISIEENFNILYSENTGRTMSNGARMSLDPLGTFIGHRIRIKKKLGKEKEFDELFDYITKPRYNGVWVEAVHNQSTIRYEAYISNGRRAVSSITPEKVNWGEMELNIVAMEAQVIP